MRALKIQLRKLPNVHQLMDTSSQPFQILHLLDPLRQRFRKGAKLLFQ
jgi:hypothetical protein